MFFLFEKLPFLEIKRKILQVHKPPRAHEILSCSSRNEWGGHGITSIQGSLSSLQDVRGMSHKAMWLGKKYFYYRRNLFWTLSSEANAFSVSTILRLLREAPGASNVGNSVVVRASVS
jgi:hypothetical protein